MHPLARLGAAAGAAVLALSLAAPAHAAKYVHYDTKGDVIVSHCTYTESETEPMEEPTDECTETVDPTVLEGDVTRTAIRHTERKVIVRTSYRELTRGDDFNIHIGAIRTNEGLNRHLFLMFADGMTEVDLIRPNGNPVACRLGRTLDFTANVIEVRVPRSCLSSPRWVKVGLAHIRVNFEETETETGYTYSDSTSIDDALSPSMGEEPVWSPRIRRA